MSLAQEQIAAGEVTFERHNLPSDQPRLAFHSVLFEVPREPNGGEALQPGFFRDLNLDQIVEAITAGREEYNLKPFFYIPLTDPAQIAYRQEMMRDLEAASVFEGIRNFANQMHSMREHLTNSEKLYYKHQKEAWFLDAVEIYCEAVRTLLSDLQACAPGSRGLQAFRSYLAEYATSAPFLAVVEETKRLKSELSAVRYCLFIKGSGVTVRHCESEVDYSAVVEETFARFRQGAVDDYLVKFTDSGMNHVEARVLEGVARLNPEVFLGLDEFCVTRRGFLDATIQKFDREIQFYVAWLEYAKTFKPAGLNFCYPQVSATRKDVRSRGGFDLALAGKLVRENGVVVCNDFALSGQERILVVTGPNQGGKTTFARMFGQMHYLANLGCPVPGTEARLFLFDLLFTHFEREEDISNLQGKLENDLIRVHNILRQATPSSLIIINEIFASTTLKDAVLLGRKVMEYISQLDLLCVCVTFLDELTSVNEKTVSLVAAVVPENPTLRTFKIERRPADGLAYALAIAEKYHVTYAHLKKRIPRIRARETEAEPGNEPGLDAQSRCLNAHLMFRDQDFQLLEPPGRRYRRGVEPPPKVVPNEDALTQDLELNTLFRAMACGDPFILEVARQAVLSGLQNDADTIMYRQAILQDCIRSYPIVRDIYDLALETIESEKRRWYGVFSKHYPGSVLNSGVELMGLYMKTLVKLRHLADEHAHEFESDGFRSFFALLKAELPDEYFARVDAQLRELRFRHGVLESAQLGKGNQGTHYVLRKSLTKQPNWFQRLLTRQPPAYTFRIDDRDEAGARALGELRDRAINPVANALGQSADHVLAFFIRLRCELAFYLGCVNLRRQLEGKGVPVCFPVPAPAGSRRHSFVGLRDASLALTMDRTVVGNDLSAEGRQLFIITGANQGGKSTFLRALGLAQLMMQCGMFVAAQTFAADICHGLFTHYKREEDASMERGKLDEELNRMSSIADALVPNSMVLFNESFAATNEREGSEIATQVVRALLGAGVKVAFVTHLYEFAQRFYDTEVKDTIFLRAGRRPDGLRTFKLLPGVPFDTSFGADLYARIFATAPRTAKAA